MAFEFILALFLIGFGISIAGAGTHFYQGLRGEVAHLRADGETVFGMFGHLIMSFVCGPYIILRMGLQLEGQSRISTSINLLVGALVSCGWAFITGLLFLGFYFAVIT